MWLLAYVVVLQWPSLLQVAASAESQVQSEFAQLQEQLSGVEQYAVRYLEAERAHITSQELQMAEVGVHHHPRTQDRNALTLFLFLFLNCRRTLN